MSREYVLYLHTDVEPEPILEAMYQAIGCSPNIECRHTPFATFYEGPDGPGYFVSINKNIKGSGPASYIKEIFGIDVTMDIYFGLDKFFEDEQLRNTSLVRMIVAALQHVSGDAVLIFDSLGSEASLLRKAGQLIIDSTRSLWNPSTLDLVTIPYQIGDLSEFK